MSDHYNYDKLIKVITLGDSSVGKTDLLNRINDKVPCLSYTYTPTIGVDFFQLVQEYYNKIIKLQFWDTAGQERFNSITNSFILKKDIVLLCFSLDNLESFKNLSKWLKKVRELNETAHLVLVGTKSDSKLGKLVNKLEIETFMSNNNINYYVETSAIKNKGIKNCIKILLEIGNYIKSPCFQPFNISSEEKLDRQDKCCTII